MTSTVSHDDLAAPVPPEGHGPSPTAAPPRTGWFRDPIVWGGLATAGLALGGLVQLAGSLFGVPAGNQPTLDGARLGMTAEAVRARFEPAEGARPGRFRSFAEDDVAVLVWEPETEAAPTRFEFHAGVLVAIEAVIPEDHALAGPDGVTASTGWVLKRGTIAPMREGDAQRPAARPAGGPPPGTPVTILARDCPAHAEEVARLLTEL
ncbi:MAG TPA: hypothetical protein RMF84_07275 [Polyangiaceae bacterium LLY-WYZ-14_1]|nr:hypothetical protein [Polyangiaceae bacterium LLY-WYZ-14_1]